MVAVRPDGSHRRPPNRVDNGSRDLVKQRTVFDSLSIVRQLTAAGIDREHADAIADGIRQAAEHGDYVTPAALRAETASVVAAISAAETRMTWRMLGVGGIVIAAIRLLG